MSDLAVHHPVADLFPMLTPDELRDLADDIAAEHRARTHPTQSPHPRLAITAGHPTEVPGAHGCDLPERPFTYASVEWTAADALVDGGHPIGLALALELRAAATKPKPAGQTAVPNGQPT